MSRRGENIYKRKDGRWEGRYIVGYDVNGKAKYKAVYAHTYNEVKARLFEEKSKKAVDKLPHSNTITVEEWFRQWLADIKNNIKLSTYAVYQRYLYNHIIPFFGGVRLYKLNKALIRQFINSKNGLSAATIQDIFLFFRSGLKAAHKEGLIESVWEDVSVPKASTTAFRVFSKDEQRIIENAVRSSDEDNYIGILICLYTGLRIGEVCALKWSDINFIGRTLTVSRTIQRIDDRSENGTQIIISEPKSAHSKREIPLPEFLVHELKRHRSKVSSFSTYVMHKNGQPIEPRTYQYQFERLLKMAGIERAKFHTLRHTFSTRALEMGFDIKTLSEILGHANASITLKQYAHSLDEHKRKSMDALGRLYG